MESKLVLSKLFEPIKIGKMTVKNRIAMGPMGTCFGNKYGMITEQSIDYYEARARGGAGLIIVENATVDFVRGTHSPHRLSIDSDLTLPGLTDVVKVIKKHGARAAIQLIHAGRQAKTKVTGFQPLAPSPIPYPGGSHPQGEMPRQITIDEINEVIALFAQAADRAKRAGFEGIEVQAAHGYLLAEFLSPFSNQRQDQYGGSLENRARILIEVLKAIRKSVGDDLALWCRLNGQENGVENGLTLEDTKAIAMMVNDLVDAIHVSVWGYGLSALANNPYVPGALLPLAAAIKKVVTVPVMAVGRLDAELGEQAIRDGKADIIVLARPLLTDPELPNKAVSRRLEDIRPCIACFHCQDSGTIMGEPITCTVNAALGREKELEIKLAKKIKKIAVIGSGPAGMEAAAVLAERGHRIVLLEKEAYLGGQMKLAMLPPHKREMIEPLVTFMTTRLKKLNVETRLNTEATLEIVTALRPDAVIVATGAIPIIPKLPGVNQGNVVTAIDVLSGKAEAGRRVVIVGGGLIGCETAEFLFEKGKEVTVVEMLPELATDMGFRARLKLLSRITALPITFLTGVNCQQIQKGGIDITTKENKEQSFKADTVILAVGTKPNNSLMPLLKTNGFEAYMAGDCWRIGRIIGAISDGLILGCNL